MNNAPVSALHKKVGEFLRERLPDATIEGWPDSEANIGHMLGYKETNLRLDYLVTLPDKRSFAVEVQSNLHDDRGISAWNGSREDHLARIARDKMKRDMCSDLDLPVLYVWHEDDLDTRNLDSIIRSATVITRADTEDKQIVKRTIINGCGGYQQWKPQKIESEQKLDGSRKMGSKSPFGPGTKMSGGSSFKR